ncbi:unnamed protein product [Paramecium sonneborni]|uniref:Myb-like domain-containing protein n=1 Tax=Paramecium sonneborni TaxID=65129 RepID=A0A8S1LL68_9CILI|nr:unnamed protein product [Paramecium sonneborni]
MSKQIVHHQSQSLWNYTLSPGWTMKEVEILNLALMKFGIGKWRKIINSECLPGKSIGQIYMQTQRLLGQQSLGEFMGLQVDLKKVYLHNMQKKNVFRKNNSIINTGDNMTQEERKKRIAENKKNFGISPADIALIKLPRYHVNSQTSFLSHDEIMEGNFTTVEKINNLCALKKDILRKLKKIENGEIEETFDEEVEQKRRYKKVMTDSDSSSA